MSWNVPIHPMIHGLALTGSPVGACVRRVMPIAPSDRACDKRNSRSRRHIYVGISRTVAPALLRWSMTRRYRLVARVSRVQPTALATLLSRPMLDYTLIWDRRRIQCIYLPGSVLRLSMQAASCAICSIIQQCAPGVPKCHCMSTPASLPQPDSRAKDAYRKPEKRPFSLMLAVNDSIRTTDNCLSDRQPIDTAH